VSNNAVSAGPSDEAQWLSHSDFRATDSRRYAHHQTTALAASSIAFGRTVRIALEALAIEQKPGGGWQRVIETQANEASEPLQFLVFADISLSRYSGRHPTILFSVRNRYDVWRIPVE
jgi:hypothetical protein